MVADGAGGLVKVQDRRFETGEWPIGFEMRGEHADTWLRYFNSECAKRGWSNSAFGQYEAGENSGSITVDTGGADKPSLAVVWERKRGKALRVRARSGGPLEFPLEEAQEFFARVNSSSHASTNAAGQALWNGSIGAGSSNTRGYLGWGRSGLTIRSGSVRRLGKMTRLSLGRGSFSLIPWYSALVRASLYSSSVKTSANYQPS
jgi:hypothetical protein